MEPLQGKQFAMNIGEPKQMIYFHIDKDIKSAIDWLLIKINSKANIEIDEINDLIYYAFEDIMKDGNSNNI